MHTDLRTRALMLLSGGLDSQLAACLLREQGVDLQGIVFGSPIIDTAAALDAAASIDLPMDEIDFTKRLVDVVERCPALDAAAPTLALECHAEMLRCAVEQMEEYGCTFICTGEVLNQGPSTQTEDALRYTAEYSGAADRILRPLSARLLPATTPEREGWISRDGLEALGGEQDAEHRAALARRFDLPMRDPPSRPSRLSDPIFTHRLADLRAHEGLHGRRALELLRVGQHFRLGPVTKLVLGRTEEEKSALNDNAELYDLILDLDEIPGPTGLLPLLATEDQVRFAAAICARYSEVVADGTAPVNIRSSRAARQIEVRPAPEEEIARARI